MRAFEGLRAFLAGSNTPEESKDTEVPRSVTDTVSPLRGGTSGAAHLERSFAFLDVTDFTSILEREGERAAITLLGDFRSVTREVAARRGVRVAKWLGDGAMLVGFEARPTLEAALEVIVRCGANGASLHGGFARGPVLLFEGDDYLGRAVNIAARLCDVASAGELLVRADETDLPEWAVPREVVNVDVEGVGELQGVFSIRPAVAPTPSEVPGGDRIGRAGW